MIIIGKYAFHRKSLHHIGSTPNPYEQAISIIGHTLSTFDEDNLIPCFGFGDGEYMFLTLLECCVFCFVDFSAFRSVASTHEKNVFSFYPGNRVCHGFEEVLLRYRQIAPLLKLSGLLCNILYQIY